MTQTLASDFTSSQTETNNAFGYLKEGEEQGEDERNMFDKARELTLSIICGTCIL